MKRTEVLGHKLQILHSYDYIYEKVNKSVWYYCLTCGLEIYYMSNRDLISYGDNIDKNWKVWDTGNASKVVELNLTCNEMIIKNILE